MSDLPEQTEEIFARNDEFDEDDDQLNLSYKVVPTNYRATSTVLETEKQTNQSSATVITPLTDFKYDIEKIFKTDKDTYLHTSIPKDHTGFVSCRITRHKGLSPTFHCYFQGQNENDLTFLLTARKHLTRGAHSEYFIGVDENTSKDLSDGNSIAVLKGINMAGNEYILYDQRFCSTHPQNKEQLAAIVYNEHILGSRVPRNLTILLHDPEKTAAPTKEQEALIDQLRSGHRTDLIELRSKTPEYNAESKTYILHFLENRVKLASHKNFQLNVSTGNAEENIVMQFGRIDENNFALDYRYPLTAVQAFGIALSAFHHRFNT